MIAAWVRGCRLIATGVFAAALFAAPTVTAGEQGQSLVLRIFSDDLSTPLVKGIAEEYLTANSALKIKTQSSKLVTTYSDTLRDGTQVTIRVTTIAVTGPFTLLDQGKTDIMASSRTDPRDDQRVLNADPPVAYALALEPLVVVVNQANRVSQLSFDQLRGIYSGRITDWSQVQGTPGPIHVHARAIGAGSSDIFNRYVMGDCGTRCLPPHTQPDPYFQDEYEALVRDRFAIGYLPLNGTGQLRHLRLQTKAGIFTQLPDEYTAQSGDYPMTLRPTIYRAVTYANPLVSKAVSEFFTQAEGDAAQVNLLLSDYFSVHATLLDASGEDRPIPKVLGSGALRLSPTIHFADGVYQTEKLDATAALQLEALIAYVRQLNVPPQNVREVAYSDGSGNRAQDVKNARRLGQAVRNALRAKRALAGDVIALGSTEPLASDFTAGGRRANRRVETWILPCPSIVLYPEDADYKDGCPTTQGH